MGAALDAERHTQHEVAESVRAIAIGLAYRLKVTYFFQTTGCGRAETSRDIYETSESLQQ